MKRFIIAFLGYYLPVLGVYAAAASVIAFFDPHTSNKDGVYIAFGAAIIAFIISWRLLKNSRKK